MQICDNEEETKPKAGWKMQDGTIFNPDHKPKKIIDMTKDDGEIYYLVSWQKQEAEKVYLRPSWIPAVFLNIRHPQILQEYIEKFI